MFVCNKEINQITWQDILSITYTHIYNFKHYLLDKGSANYTNQKILACKGLWKQLYAFNRDVDTTIFNLQEEKFEPNNYASLNANEMELLFNFMEHDHYKPHTKRMFFEFLYVVGCRKNVALELTWDQIKRKHDSKKGIDVWVVHFHDKGKWVDKSINDDF
jgi:site-specific recombinase XerD